MAWTDEQIADAVKAAEEFDPAAATVVDMSDLRSIAEAADAVARGEAELTERVALARAHGRSWTEIATALGVSRQAARQRFGGKTEPEDRPPQPPPGSKPPRSRKHVTAARQRSKAIREWAKGGKVTSPAGTEGERNA
ncbi:MAG: hypothetical protein LBI49_25600 [Nocardiopsaceae bacterium]|jgi:predicted transcriptional regulator|nr:hypothetical protein [Nocardiopsaceae bacterium]